MDFQTMAKCRFSSAKHTPNNMSGSLIKKLLINFEKH